MLRNTRRNGAEDLRLAIQDRPHGSVDQRLSGQSFPGEIHLRPAFAIMERSGVMKLHWPMRIFKIEYSGHLGKPGNFGQSETGILPINLDPGAPRISLDPL